MKPPSAWSPGTRDRRGGTDNGLIRRPGGSTRPDDGRHDGTATRPSRELGGKPKCALDPSSASAIGRALLRLDKDHCQDSPLLPFSSRDCPGSRDCHASAAMSQIMHCPKPRIRWSQFLSSDGHRRRVANRICGPAASGAIQASPLPRQIFRVPPCREASVRTRPPGLRQRRPVLYGQVRFGRRPEGFCCISLGRTGYICPNRPNGTGHAVPTNVG
jgi:hypothetical protein